MMKIYFDQMGIHLSQKQEIQLEKFYNLLITENEKYNLTAITDKKEVYIKHFLDSMLINDIGLELKDKKIIDIGIGAGFPSMPIKILEPSIQLTGLDSLNKRIAFLDLLADQLQLSDLSFVHGRAEDFGQNPVFREQYDFAVSRAVAELRLLLELVMPFVNVGGYFIAYKSIKNKTELIEAENALNLMKCKLIEVKQFVLPEDFGERDLMIIHKYDRVDSKYPRKAGIPKKKPL